MFEFCTFASGLLGIALGVLLICIVVRFFMRKPCKKLGYAILGCFVGIVVFTAMGISNSPCEHEFAIIEKIDSTCSEKGKIRKYCTICEEEFTDDIATLPHLYVEVSRIDPYQDIAGLLVMKCEVCGHETSSLITTPATAKDNLRAEFMELGFTLEESGELRRIFLDCGIETIEGAKPASDTATIDDLIVYRIVLSENRVLFFTIDHRQLYYIGLNGLDVYDHKKGVLVNIKDV